MPTLYWDPDGLNFYNDIVREVRVTASGFAFVDLFIDVVRYKGEVKVKDEELLERLDAREGAMAHDAAYALVARLGAHDPFFDTTSALWTPPLDALDLPPGAPVTLSQ